MAETSLPFMNEVQMEPTISTPLKQETKRKRPRSNDTELTKAKKPRKKMYRPKVIGEGRKRKSKATNTPQKHKQVTSKPKQPKTPNRVAPKPRTRKVAPKNSSEKSTELLEENNKEANAVVSCRDLVLVENENGSNNQVDATDSCRDLVLLKNENRAENNATDLVLVENENRSNNQVDATDSCRDLVLLKNESRAENNATVSCRDLILVKNELENEKAFVKVDGIEAKEAEEDNSKTIGIRTTAGLIERLCGWFCEHITHMPQECKGKRSSGRRPAKITERKPDQILNIPQESKRKRSSSWREPTKITERKRTLKARRCNLLLKKPHKHAVKGKKAKKNHGNYIFPVVGWLLKKPNRNRNRKKPRISSNLHCNSRDDDEDTTIKELDCQSPSDLKSNCTDASMEIAITDDYDKGTTIKEFDCQSPSGLKSRDATTNDYDEGTTKKEFDGQSPFGLQSNCKDASIGIAISDDYDEATRTKEFDCQSPSGLKSNCGDVSVTIAITNDYKEDTTIKEFESPCLKSNCKDPSVETAIIEEFKVADRTAVSNCKDPYVETAITEEFKVADRTAVSPASDKVSDMQSEGALRKMGNLSKRLSNHNGQQTMRWLDIRHFLTNSKFLNGRNEKTPPKNGLSFPRIITGSGGSMIRQPNFTISARPSGSANEMRPALKLILWNRSEGTRNSREHIRVTGETRASDKGMLGETDSCKKLLVPYVADGRYNEARFRNLPTFAGSNNSIGLSRDNSQKEGTDPSNEKQIIPYTRKRGKKASKRDHNPSSVHGMQGAIVPHPKSLNSTKKKMLGRVTLDPRDIDLWHLAIQSESNFNKEKVNDNTDTWWANERKIFRGRIDAFTATMHVILGDRRFSPWKGSVVDSVVGVFLTQNVSDHLSSSAYMLLAATFPLPPTTENYHGEEVFCIEQSSIRNERLFLCESKWNNAILENNKTTRNPEAAEELMSSNDAISPNDFLGSSIKQSLDKTLLSSTCLEDDCGTCLSSNLDGTDNTVLHSSKSTFVQEPYNSSQSSTSKCGSNEENKTSESKEVDCRNQNPLSANLNSRDTVNMLRSFGNCYLCSECIRKSKSELENNAEDSNRCEGTMEVDLQFTPNEKSQRFIDSVGKFQNQEIQLAGDVNAECCLCFECNNQTEIGIKKTTEIYNYNQEKMEAGSQPSPIDDSSKKLDVDVEKVQSQKSVIQANDITNDAGEKEAQKYLEYRDSNDFHDEKKTEIPKEKAKKSKMKEEIDWNSLQEKWDSMRRTIPCREPRSTDHMDSVDWEAVRSAEPMKIADAIKERGQHNIIARRIKEFLDRTARIHGSIDLEWLRDAPSDDVKKYLLEIDGLGLKSVECIRLLALQQVAFPVDVNVGRIAVRLGWVPLEPLPEEVQMHLLDMFPIMDSIQKYLWPRLCTLDQRTLYELHYHLITFGKVFCTKRKPNCNACPLRADCRHYASAFASARLALPGVPEKRIVTTMVPDKSFEGTAQVMNPASVLQIDGNPFPGSQYQTSNREPIIEEPQSPEPAYDESQLTDIEDLCEYDSDDVPIIRLSSGQFTTTLQNCMDDNISRALVPLHAKIASIPMPKLKHIDRLRTEHQAYELPDTHPLLSTLESRDPKDPCPYLLCILSPGEMVDSSEPPNTRCTYQELGELCTEGSCSSCNIAREQNSGTVRATLLIPCRTAMRGKFPLNGTYFQVNEVFADDESSKNPIHVPREWIWDLPRRITYFGTSTTTIFRGLSMEDIQYCFQKGFICVRGFDRRTRTPRRLAERLHRATHASVKARAKKKEDQKQKPYASNSNSPQ